MITGALPYRGVMGSDNFESKNFNDYTTNGFYANGGTNNGFSNSPHIADNGTLVVITNHQFWFSNYQKFALKHRRYNGSVWTNWEDIGL